MRALHYFLFAIGVFFGIALILGLSVATATAVSYLKLKDMVGWYILLAVVGGTILLIFLVIIMVNSFGRLTKREDYRSVDPVYMSLYEE